MLHIHQVHPRQRLLSHKVSLVLHQSICSSYLCCNTKRKVHPIQWRGQHIPVVVWRQKKTHVRSPYFKSVVHSWHPVWSYQQPIVFFCHFLTQVPFIMNTLQPRSGRNSQKMIQIGYSVTLKKKYEAKGAFTLTELRQTTNSAGLRVSYVRQLEHGDEQRKKDIVFIVSACVLQRGLVGQAKLWWATTSTTPPGKSLTDLTNPFGISRWDFSWLLTHVWDTQAERNLRPENLKRLTFDPVNRDKSQPRRLKTNAYWPIWMCLYHVWWSQQAANACSVL